MPVRDASDTLRVGERAPAFTLAAANREGSTSLSQLLASGTAVLEFVRGTW